MLNDGMFSGPIAESVQYQDNVTITIDTGSVCDVEFVEVNGFYRANDFDISSASVYTSDDNKNWILQGTAESKKKYDLIRLKIPVNLKTRFIKVDVRRPNSASRILLGEIIVKNNVPEAETKYSKTQTLPRPLHVKRTFDKALLDRDVHFLYGCYPTDVLFDASGDLAGVIMANRSGRQAVRAKVIIDATERGTVARLAGAKFAAFPAGVQTFKRVVVGGAIPNGSKLKMRKIPTLIEGVTYEEPKLKKNTGKAFAVTEYTLELKMKDASFASFASADQQVRDLTYQIGQVGASEYLFQVPPDPVMSIKASHANWTSAASLSLESFQPKSVKYIYVLGGCAEIPRDAAEKMLRPIAYMQTGSKVGTAAAVKAKNRKTLSGIRVAGGKSTDAVNGDTMEFLKGVRGSNSVTKNFIESGGRQIPVFGKYDVVVIGGGTGGASAAIGAARQGAKTLVVEYLSGLGGVGTLGMINNYWYGNVIGFTKEVTDGTAAGRWDVEQKMHWYRKELRKAGCDIWMRSIGCGAFVENGRVKGAIVATPFGRGVVLANTVIDSTGNADIAVAAGSAYEFVSGDRFGMQGAGLPTRALGERYNNTDWTYVDDSDMLDRTRTQMVAKLKFKGQYDLGQLIDSRERRHIVGEYTLTPLDIINKRTFEDTICWSKSNLDSHGYTNHILFKFWFPERRELVSTYVPYRCLLPKGLDGILVTGLGVSADRDAFPIIRMQADVQNQGYAAGVAAAMAAGSNTTARNVDVKQLQKHLVDKGNLSVKVLEDINSAHATAVQVEAAVNELDDSYEGIWIILDADKNVSLPILRKAYTSGKCRDKLACAHVLAMLGDPIGAGDLIRFLADSKWDDGWTFVGMGNHGAGYSRQDSLIIALGVSKVSNALPIVIERVRQLDEQTQFSHVRSCALYLEELADPKGAQALYNLLKKKGFSGHDFQTLEDVFGNTPADSNDNTVRRASLRELILARALYRCGDHKGLAEDILNKYAADLRGVYSQHARAVLKK